MKKTVLSLLLCAALLLPSLPAAQASGGAPATVQEAAQILAALDIMVGDEKGELHLDRAVTRAEFTKLLLAASSYRSGVGSQASVAPYPDVPREVWYAPWVQAARDYGLVRGNLAGYFEPERTITLAEGVTMLLRLLGYQDGEFAGAWPTPQMSLARSLELDAAVEAGERDALSRKDALYLFYNLLSAPMKGSGAAYITTLGYPLTSNGQLDRVSILNSAMGGPLVLEGQALSSLPFDPATAQVYRNGRASSLSSLRELDVLYYSGSMRTLWAWSDKVTGMVQAVSPSAASPAAVTVGGKSYSLSGAEAVYALSDLGSFRVGDTVTLLLGRSGECVSVRSPLEASEVLVGLVTAVGAAPYLDAGGNRYSRDTVSFTATDGEEYSVPWEGSSPRFSVGDLVQAVPTADGFQLLRPASSALSGTVTDSGAALGSLPFAQDVEILDTWEGSAQRIYPRRLAGVTLSEGDVRYFSLNDAGEISRLILGDVTGDLFSYGVLTQVSEFMSGLVTRSTYAYDLSGVPGVFTSQNLSWNLSQGPCQVRFEGDRVSRIRNLTAVPLLAVDESGAVSPQGRLPVASSLVAYQLRDGAYFLTTLAQISEGSFQLTGYYDAPPAEGGVLRVIIARPE